MHMAAGDSPELLNFVEAKAARVLEQVIALGHSNFGDLDLFELVREALAADLERSEPVLVPALFRAAREQATHDLVSRVVDHAAEHFRLDDRILSAIVAPITV